MYVALAAILAVALAAMPLARLYRRQDRMVFRPRPGLDRSPASIGVDYTDLRLAAGDDAGVAAWWISGAEDAPAVVYFHGSAGNLTYELPVVQFLHSLGLNSLLVEYVGYDGDGLRPTEAGCYRSAEAAWEHVTLHRGFSGDRVILFGHSLGAAVAAHIAVDRSCAGLVLQSGFTSVGDMAAEAYPYLPVRPFVRTRMNTLDSVARCPCSVLVVHSRDDEHIPYRHGLRLYDGARTTKKLVTLSGSHFGHTWPRLPEVEAAWRELVAGDFATWAGPPEGPDAQ